jgi:hypothetical protein
MNEILLSSPHQNGKFVERIVVEQGNKPRKMTLAIVEQKPGVRVIQSGPHELGIGILRQDVKGKSLLA